LTNKAVRRDGLVVQLDARANAELLQIVLRSDAAT
jgi:hypothetical protein